MLITKKMLPRRTILRGLGVTVALPLLDAMVPALSAMSRTAAAPTKRAGFIYVPNGQAMTNWVPSEAGKHFSLPAILRPLKAVRDQVVVVSGLANLEAESRDLGTGPHTRCGSVWLNGVRPKRTEGADIRAGKTADQYAADALGGETPLRSLELARASNNNKGNCDNGYSCAYVNTFSWRTATTPLPMENDPRVVFERLFGAGTTAEQRVSRMRQDRSLLDALTDDIASLKKGLGLRDQATIGDFLDAVREVEQRIQRSESYNATSEVPIERPIGIPPSHEEFASLMYDLAALAYQADITRVVSFQLGREQSSQTYPFIGVPEADHATSHHGNDPGKILTRTKVNTYHMQLYARFLERLQATPDGDGTLLDQSLLLYGSGMGNGNVHSPHNLPLMLAGGGCGELRGGQHLAFSADSPPPMMNLCLNMLDKLNVELESLGDSTGRLAGL
jgi:hypothetical protein